MQFSKPSNPVTTVPNALLKDLAIAGSACVIGKTRAADRSIPSSKSLSISANCLPALTSWRFTLVKIITGLR